MTIREISTRLNVTQQNVYKRLKSHGIDIKTLKDNETGQLTEDGLQTISKIFGVDFSGAAPGAAENSTNDSATQLTIEQLRKEVETLTTEVDKLNDKNNYLTEKVEMLQSERDSLKQQLLQANQLHLMALQRIPALQAPTEAETKTEPSERGLRGWWNRRKHK